MGTIDATWTPYRWSKGGVAVTAWRGCVPWATEHRQEEGQTSLGVSDWENHSGCAGKHRTKG